MRLRKLEEKDAEGMLEWMQDPEIQKGFRFNAGQKDMQSVLDFIQHAGIKLIDGEDIHYAIADENDEYLGTISLKNVKMTDKRAEYAISLRGKAQGKGIAMEVTQEILELAFRYYGLERVYLNVLEDNERAIRLYEKSGFVYEGAFRRHLFLRGEYKTVRWYSMLREEYLMKKNVCGGDKRPVTILRVVFGKPKERYMEAA